MGYIYYMRIFRKLRSQAVGRRIEALMKNTDIRPSDIAQLMHISVPGCGEMDEWNYDSGSAASGGGKLYI